MNRREFIRNTGLSVAAESALPVVADQTEAVDEVSDAERYKPRCLTKHEQIAWEQACEAFERYGVFR